MITFTPENSLQLLPSIQMKLQLNILRLLSFKKTELIFSCFFRSHLSVSFRYIKRVKKKNPSLLHVRLKQDLELFLLPKGISH